ncbi:high affinity cAMP-specific 3',5'-cyclic phosphodiesterase 7A-like isoform X2 [Physella acuta]|uniref:high affinity cAMP-specific 3',5'-cyclic phosphodiesterase 7A-like isoform X2 n=1 Tax=Physella acuta TaxID=109671 RepID=UPI0027DC42FC|nr:high affinity cAMP-specific 3',5'-cyclic phosphodiesterase 7A-like isoform X2 [Physella acuta]
MFPFTTSVSILRRHEKPRDWHQINGTMTFLICPWGQGEQRRGAVSYESNDNNAIYIRMLGDTHGSPAVVDSGQCTSDLDQQMLESLKITGRKLSYRSRCMSLCRPNRRFHKNLPSDVCASSNSKLLANIGTWNFNIFTFDILSSGRPLFQVAYHLFETYHFISHFQLDVLRLIHFLSLVEDNYHESNPYHNAVHAADVTQSMHCYLQEKEIFHSTTHLEKMSALVAALTHDLDHPGVNNTFLIATSNHLATLYQNSSVLENHHWRSAAALLKETGLLSHLSSEQSHCFLQQVKMLILATDITRQQEFVLKFSNYIEKGELHYKQNVQHRHFMLQMALKCADISNPCRPWEISQRWSRKICQEFFLQGDTERALNVDVTPVCDRYGNTVPNIQHGFMQFVVSPLFKVWDKFLGTELSALMLHHLSHNQAQWKAKIDAGDSDTEDADLPDLAALKFAQEKVQKTCPVSIELSHEEDYDGISEEDDVVENTVNLMYHYQPEDTLRCFSPLIQDTHLEPSNRRFSLPYVRKDLSFYLGLNKETGNIKDELLRRQSLPTASLYFDGNCIVVNASPRSLSMDALFSRPKISNLSPNMEASFLCLPLFTSLQKQTLMLQGGSFTRFTSNPSSRRESYDQTKLTANTYSSDLKPDANEFHVGLASSWPVITSKGPRSSSPSHLQQSDVASSIIITHHLNAPQC